ncbi:hypothetical protein ACQP2U_43775 (plasmid) [Nocardia sp. CA-084685]|uniref:hypothetical protein n=1 Tax=Nocardia sp. CA-084685 TaxID=3239970 RepID=UPI003D9514D5
MRMQMREPQWRFDGTGADGDYERMKTDRSWAPPGGTSSDEHFQVASELSAAFRAELAAAIPAVAFLANRPGDLAPRPPQASSTSTLWQADGGGVFKVHVGVEHRPAWPIGDHRTHLAIEHYPDADSLQGCLALDSWLYGLVARDAVQLAAMTLAIIEHHRCATTTA